MMLLNTDNIRLLDAGAYIRLMRQLSDTISISPDKVTERLAVNMATGFIFTFIHGTLDRPLGSATVIIEPKVIHDGASVAHIEDIVVDRSERGKGIAKMMVRHVIDFAREKGCYKALLHCAPQLETFYSSLGFVSCVRGMRLDIN